MNLGAASEGPRIASDVVGGAENIPAANGKSAQYQAMFLSNFVSVLFTNIANLVDFHQMDENKSVELMMSADDHFGTTGAWNRTDVSNNSGNAVGFTNLFQILTGT